MKIFIKFFLFIILFFILFFDIKILKKKIKNYLNKNK
jgi:hypothetical protein